MKHRQFFWVCLLISLSSVAYASAFPCRIPSLDESAASTHDLDNGIIRDHTGLSDMETVSLIRKEVDQIHCTLCTSDLQDQLSDAFDDIIDPDIEDLIFSPDGNLIVAGLGKMVKIWARQEDDSFQLIQALYGHEDSVETVAFSPDGRFLASSDGTIKIWSRQDNNTFQLLQVLECEQKDDCSSNYGGIAFSPDGAVIAAGHTSCAFDPDIPTISTIKILTRQKNNTFQLSQSMFVKSDKHSWIQTLVFSPDSKLLACSMFDKSDVMMWSANDDKTFSFYQSINCCSDDNWSRTYDKVSSIAFSHDNAELAIGLSTYEQSANILFWSREKNKFSHVIPCDRSVGWDATTYTPQSIIFSSDDSLLSCVFADGIKVWSRRNDGGYEFSHVFCNEKKSMPVSVMFSPDDKFLVSGLWNGTIKLWSRQINNTFKPWYILNDGRDKIPDPINFANGGNCLALNINNHIQIWSKEIDNTLNPLQMLHVGIGHERDNVYSIALSKDASYFATGSDDGVIRIWSRGGDNTSFQLIQTLDQEMEGHNNRVNLLNFSSDNSIFISGSIDDVVKVWIRQDDNTFTCASTVCNHYRSLKAVVLSNDAKYGAFISEDGIMTIGLQQNGTFQILQILRHGIGKHKDWLNVEWSWVAAFSPDNKFLATVSEDSTISIWARQDDDTFQFHQLLNVRSKNKQLVKAICFGSESRLLFSLPGNNDLDIWAIESKKEFSLYSYILAALGISS